MIYHICLQCFRHWPDGKNVAVFYIIKKTTCFLRNAKLRQSHSSEGDCVKRHNRKSEIVMQNCTGSKNQRLLLGYFLYQKLADAARLLEAGEYLGCSRT
jgi:hypothetical protein